ncbi:MAG: hypothetical protein WCA85_25925 [Paraburkholderia sp.]|uniref:hypothetical protein n=1 Tax=Paraburkholderia sp. TaxID=1926495 RepID=UPI003C41AFA8
MRMHIAAIMTFTVACSVAACSKAPNAAPPSVAVAPVAPMHNYVLEQNGEYGYQPSVSEQERQQGVGQVPLIMVRYFGKQHGEYRLRATADGQTTETTCKEPCTYVKEALLIDGNPVQSQTMQNTPGTLIYAVMADAINGQLNPYKEAP